MTLLTYYGDDFTGSTDVMEALATHGVDTVLFTRLPTEAELQPFQKCEAIGLAGTSRSRDPAWMDAHLPAAFNWLKKFNARICHYKVCSTFDSAPHIGSIGRATDIGLRVFSQPETTLLLGAPQIKRYSFAGHLFAAYQGQVYRIDRHPVMRCHPVTPMHESDVLKHLSKQTSAVVHLLDVHDRVTQIEAGKTLLAMLNETGPFTVGSSGVEYAVLAALEKDRRSDFAPVAAVDRMLVVSGSVSPTTARQISHASQHGFTAIAADVEQLARGNVSEILLEAENVLQRGGSPLVFSAAGPATDQGEVLNAIKDGRHQLAKSLGRIARHLVEKFSLSRIVFAGGDTSSHALGELDGYALTMRYPLLDSPGSPLCKLFSSNSVFDGLELAMKGGQVGGDDYFVKLKEGLQ